MACRAMTASAERGVGWLQHPARQLLAVMMAASGLSLAPCFAAEVPTTEVASGEILASGCTGCHGTGGVSNGSSMPSLAGLERRYFMRVMNEYKYDQRAATLMDRIAKGYSGEELRRLSFYFSELPWQNLQPEAATDPEAEELHETWCEECHEQRGRLQDRDVARIAGQSADFLYMQLIQYRAQEDKVTQPDKMTRALEGLDDRQLRMLADFYAQQR